MTHRYCTSTIDARQDSRYWDASDPAEAHAAFADPTDPPVSQRQYAKEHDIPRATLGHWLRQPVPQGLDPKLVSFFRCPVGLAFLRRLVLAALLVFHQQNPCGIRSIGLFLELLELDHFVGSSYCALYSLDIWLQENLVLFGKEERQRLAAALADSGIIKDIGLCLDENFHNPLICLVGIEPVSNFIVVEANRDRRDSVTWAKIVNAGLDGLPVHLVYLTSDQASGLTCCAETELEVHHNPDLQHLQSHLLKPILLPLARP